MAWIDEFYCLEGVIVKETASKERDSAKAKKKPIGIIIIVILVLATLGGAIYFVAWVIDDSVEHLYIGTVEENADHTGIRVMALADSGGGASVEGSGRVRIIYDNEETYDNSIHFKDDEAHKEIRFEEFVVGNGNYTVEVAYGDKSDVMSYNVGWVLEYIEIDTELASIERKADGTFEQGELTLKVNAFNPEGLVLFTMGLEVKSDLDKLLITDDINDYFKEYDHDLKDTTTGKINGNIQKVNGAEWLVLNERTFSRYLIKEKGGVLEVSMLEDGLWDKVKKADLELKIFFEENKVDSYQKVIEDICAFSYDTNVYSSYGAGEYRFEISATNPFVKDDSEYSEDVSVVLKESLNQRIMAGLDSNYPFDSISQCYHRTISITTSQASGGYEVDFDGSASFNDGDFTAYRWDWEFDIGENFDIEDTGAQTSHIFNLDPIPKTTHFYVGFQVEGDRMVDTYDYEKDEWKVQVEIDTVIIDIEFQVTII